MKITKKQLKQIIKEAYMSLDPHHSPGTAWKQGRDEPVEDDVDQRTQIINDLKAIFHQFDADTLTQQGNLELIKSKVDALVDMSAGVGGE